MSVTVRVPFSEVRCRVRGYGKTMYSGVLSGYVGFENISEIEET